MKQFKIKENYLLLKKWWETIDLTNYEKSFLNREIISFNQQLLRLKEKKLRIDKLFFQKISDLKKSIQIFNNKLTTFEMSILDDL